MQQTTDHPTTAPESGLEAAALRAEAWAGEAFLHNGEDPEQVLAPGTARRRALDDALAELEAGAREPSYGWKVRYGLMLGLERILSDRPPRLASGTELRRHQIDALAGMLTELIAATQSGEAPLNGNGAALEELEPDEEDEEPDELAAEEEADERVHVGPDPGAVRRYRFRHPTASGKTIAAARRGLIAPLRCLRVPPVAAIHSVPIVGGDFEERALAQALDPQALNQAAASLYRDRFDSTPGIVYAAGVDHAYHLAQEFRAAGLKAEAVSGRTMRLHPRKEAGVVVDFVNKGATHNERVITLHSLLDADFYREGARVTPAPRRRVQRRAKRKLTPAPWLVPVTPDVGRRLAVIQREWQRVDPRFLDEDEQRYWATIAGRQMRFDERQAFVEKFTERGASKAALETFLSTCAAQNPNRRLRLIALADRVSMRVERADFDDLVTLVTQAPPWDKDRAAGVRILLRAIADGKPDAPEQILARWTWRLARAVRKTLDRKASQEYPDAKRLLGALANSRGHRHEENAVKLVGAALQMPLPVGAAL